MFESEIEKNEVIIADLEKTLGLINKPRRGTNLHTVKTYLESCVQLLAIENNRLNKNLEILNTKADKKDIKNQDIKNQIVNYIK